MRIRKKIRPVRAAEEEPEPIDFDWVYVIGLKMGLSYRETGYMYYGRWHDMFEIWKEQYNFETKKMIYKTADDYKIGNLDEL